MRQKKNTESASAGAPRAGFRRFAARRPRTLLVIVNLVGIAVILFVVEAVLRSNGAVPGYLDMGYDDFRPLPEGQKLEVSGEYYTDSLGIYRALPDTFNRRGDALVNSWGFRGPEFDLQDSMRRRIMLIGDSFTWGAHATPLDSCFADLIRRPDWQVFNLGIPGTDPDQYDRMAQTYVPLLKPDVVCLFFYMGNDVMPFPKVVQPHANLYHITNIGWLNPYLEGGYIGGPEETYAFFLKRFSIPPHNFFNRVCGWTVLGTRLWQVLDRLGWVDSQREPAVQSRIDDAIAARKTGPYSGAHLRNIAALCSVHNIDFHLFCIPKHNALMRPDTVSLPRMLDGLPYVYPEDLTAEDYYGRPDGHFNNHGHRKMAHLIQLTIDN